MSSAMHQRKQIRGLVAGVAVTALAATGLVHAQPTEAFAIFDGLQAVSDNELSDMRGRYVASGKIAYFGVNMTTTWQTAGGQTINSNLELGITPGGQPRITLTPTVTFSGGDGAASMAGTGSTNPLSHVDGASQTIQVAGYGNGAANDLQLRITRGSAPDSAPSSGETTLVMDGTGGLTAASGILQDGLGVQIRAPGEGSAEQMLSRHGIGQAIRITGDFHQLANHMTLDARFSDTSRVNGNLLHSLKSIRDLRGAF